MKEKEVNRTIKQYTALAAGIAVTPIPVADAVALTAMQTKMASDIYAKYGIDTTVSELIKHLIQNNIVSIVGKLAAGNLLKFIPVIGPWVGAGVNAVVASSITYGLGKTISYLCKKAIKAAWEGKIFKPMSDEDFKRIVNEYTKTYKDSHG